MYKDKDWLYEEYIVNMRSTTDIAKECGVSYKTICRWANKLGVQLRDPKEAIDIKYGNARKTKMQRAMAHYIQSQSLTTNKSKNPEWKGRK